MRTDFGVVFEKLGLLKLTHHGGQFGYRQRLLDRISTRCQIALRGLVQFDQRLARQIQHEIKRLLAHDRCAVKINRAHITASFDAIAMAGAFGEVDLIGEIDRSLGAGFNTGVAAGAGVEINRVGRGPLGLEFAEPAFEAFDLARHDRKAALGRQLGGVDVAGHEHTDIEPPGQTRGPAECGRCIADDQGGAAGLIAHAGLRGGFGQLRHRQQGGDFGAARARLTRPAAGLADVDEPQRHFTLRRASGQFGKQRRFLGAGDGECLDVLRSQRQRPLVRADFAAA